MKKINIHKGLIISLLLFFIISILTIKSAEELIPYDNLMIKQLIWYLIGFLLIFLIIKIGNKNIYDKIKK